MLNNKPSYQALTTAVITAFLWGAIPANIQLLFILYMVSLNLIP